MPCDRVEYVNSTLRKRSYIGRAWQRIWERPPFNWPRRLMGRLTRGIPTGLWLANVFAQRILGMNGAVPWMVHFTSWASGDICIGRNVWRSFALSGGCYVQGINGVYIGDDTIFAPGVKIVSANHDPENLNSWKVAGPVVIGKHCWIGANAVILPGVTIGDRAVVGAGAVVTKSIPDNSTVVGVPARPVGKLASSEAGG
jgi:carbonic anhydrase/acetyltransferase-like protein (isoleucine patch superfamily)